MLEVTLSSFSYAETEILKDVSFALQKGEHLAVLGESGCGKSTLLHIIYGLLHVEHGSLTWDSKPLLGPRHNLVPGEPFMKLVAQELNVMPFTTVAENLATHLSRLNEKDDASRVSELLEVVDLVEHAGRKVKDLSGGQKQRVALAKALAKEPELLLLDEPFSHIDSFRKNKLRRVLFNYLKEKNIACITATHDSEEALAFSDKLLVLHRGKTAAYGNPEEVYTSLSSPYLAGFFGEINSIPAGVLSKELHILLPHQLKLSSKETKLKGEVIKNYFKGNHYLIQLKSEYGSLFFESAEKLPLGSKVYLTRQN